MPKIDQYGNIISLPAHDRILWSQVKDRRCAQCYGPVTLKYIDEEWLIVCLKNCQPGGHISASSAERIRQQDKLDAFEVGQNYPELDQNKLTDEEIENGKDALW